MYNPNETESLFRDQDGSAVMRARIAQAATAVDRLSEETIQERSDYDLLAQIAKSLAVTVPTLDRDNVEVERSVRMVQRRDMWGELVQREVTSFSFSVPFAGDRDIFRMRPNTWSSSPRATINATDLVITIDDELDPQRLKDSLGATLDDIDQYLTWHRQMWATLDQEVAQAARARLAFRRHNISNGRTAEHGLKDLGFKFRD